MSEESDHPAITLVDLETMEVYFVNGTMAPITHMMTIDGADTDDPNLAAKIVAGPLPDSGKWLSCAVDNYDREQSGIEPLPLAVIVDMQKNCVTFENGSVVGVSRWLGPDQHPCDPRSAAYLETRPDERGYAARVDLTPRDELAILE